MDDKEWTVEDQEWMDDLLAEPEFDDDWIEEQEADWCDLKDTQNSILSDMRGR